MNASGLRRVRYYHGQELSVSDFVAEQRFHIAMDRRHNIGMHGWGIVRGLEVAGAPEASEGKWTITIRPGFAIDGYGRELILNEPVSHHLDLDLLGKQAVTAVEVWLDYNIVAASCHDRGKLRVRGFSATMANQTENQPDRWNESPVVRLRNRKELRDSDGVPQDRTFTETGGSKSPDFDWDDDKPNAWPVFLGQITIPDEHAKEPQIDYKGRPYAGLVGHVVRPMSGDARMIIGKSSPNDPACFAVHVKPQAEQSNETPPQEEKAETLDPTPADDPALWVDDAGGVSVTAGLHVSGDFRISDGALKFEATNRTAATEPGWQIYRTRSETDNVEELRIEIPEPADQSRTGAVAVGIWTGKEHEFKELLTVVADGTVIVEGNLRVKGLINPPSDQGQKSPAEETLAAAKLSAVNAMATSNALEAMQEKAAEKAAGKSLAGWLSGIIKKMLALFGLGPGDTKRSV